MGEANRSVTAVDTRERKRSRFDESAAGSNKKRSTLLAVGVAAAIVLAIAYFLLKGGDPTRSVERGMSTPPAPVTSGARPTSPSSATTASAVALSPEGDVFRIPVSSITTEATFFNANAGQSTVPFFAVRDGAGRVHVALDACHACARAKKGYAQAGSDMQCRNCGMKFAIAEITDMADKGGCHPIVLPSTTSGDSIVVKTADVAAGAKWF